VTADALMAFVGDRIADYKRVREVEFIDKVPRTASGKILRRELAEREKAAAAGSQAGVASARCEDRAGEL